MGAKAATITDFAARTAVVVISAEARADLCTARTGHPRIQLADRLILLAPAARRDTDVAATLQVGQADKPAWATCRLAVEAALTTAAGRAVRALIATPEAVFRVGQLFDTACAAAEPDSRISSCCAEPTAGRCAASRRNARAGDTGQARVRAPGVPSAGAADHSPVAVRQEARTMNTDRSALTLIVAGTTVIRVG